MPNGVGRPDRTVLTVVDHQAVVDHVVVVLHLQPMWRRVAGGDCVGPVHAIDSSGLEIIINHISTITCSTPITLSAAFDSTLGSDGLEKDALQLLTGRGSCLPLISGSTDPFKVICGVGPSWHTH